MKSRYLAFALLALPGLTWADHYATVNVSPNVLAGKDATIDVKFHLGTNMKSVCPSIEVNFGDGSSQTAELQYLSNAPTPTQIARATHVYGRPGAFSLSLRNPVPNPACPIAMQPLQTPVTVIVTPDGLTGTISPTLGLESPPVTHFGGSPFSPYISNQPQTPQIPEPNYLNTGSNEVVVQINGTGLPCELAFINWGDGTPPSPISGSFPLKAQHHYEQGGDYKIAVRAAPGKSCQGGAGAQFYAYPKPYQFTGVQAPSEGVVGQPLTLMVKGKGVLAPDVSQGDGTDPFSFTEMHFLPENNFSKPVKLLYKKPGVYTFKLGRNLQAPELTAQITIKAATPLQPTALGFQPTPAAMGLTPSR